MARSSLRFWLAPFLILGLAGSQERDGGPAVGEEPSRPQSTPAAEVWERPGQSLGSEVVLTVQVHSHAETWNPFVTRFGTGEYVCLRAWSDEQFPWRAEDFARPAVRVFARRESAGQWALAEAERYQRFELTCIVRSVFGGVPWVEVSGVKPLIRQVGDGTVIHASRGTEAFEKKGWSRAKLELERALVGGIPERSRLELERLIAICDEELAKRVILRPYRPGKD